MINEKAGIDIAPTSNVLWNRESCWKDIANLWSTASQLRNARSSAQLTLTGQVAAEQLGLHWRYLRLRSFDQLGRRNELGEGISAVIQLKESNWQESFQLRIGSGQLSPKKIGQVQAE